MNDLLGRLHGALARQRAFVADASHELRTPFAVLRGELELAGRPGRTIADLRLAVANAAEEAARLNRLTDDLLLLARSDSDRMALRLGPTELGALLETSAAHARLRAEPAGIVCRVEVPPANGRDRRRPYPTSCGQPGGQRVALRSYRDPDRDLGPEER